jgi:uncharacterized protein (DUF58 family)
MALDPAAAARLARLRLHTRLLVEGVLSGLHRSPHHGQSVEFSEHKEYTPGDDVRHIDWKAYGKFDRYYIKRFEQETNLRAYLVLDASASMAYGEPESKWEVATAMASALASLLAGQQDAVGLAVAQQGEVSVLPARSSPGYLNVIMEHLAEVRPSGPTDLGHLADALAEKVRRRSLIVLFSDLFDENPDGLRRLLVLRAQQNDLCFLHLLDRTELTFPFEDPTLFLSMEDTRRLEANPRELRKGYLDELRGFLGSVHRISRERDCDYQLVATDEPLESALVQFLSRRDRRGSGKSAAVVRAETPVPS